VILVYEIVSDLSYQQPVLRLQVRGLPGALGTVSFIEGDDDRGLSVYIGNVCWCIAATHKHFPPCLVSPSREPSKKQEPATIHTTFPLATSGRGSDLFRSCGRSAASFK